MFRHYQKTYRIQIPQIDVPGKHVLSSDERRRLLAGPVVIEEKMDGANAGIIRHKKGFHLQKKGSLVGQSEHEQFQFFWNWAYQWRYDNIMSLPEGYIVYGELLFAVHTIYYDRLPDYFLVFDVWDGERYLTRVQRQAFCEKHGFCEVPFIVMDTFDVDELYEWVPKESAYGDTAEGIVVKRITNKGDYIRGKIVKPEFIKHLEESLHWTKYEIRRNKLK
jgi:ATP-dependent RNA circularization protein (DNA/RNA ligase family)